MPEIHNMVLWTTTDQEKLNTQPQIVPEFVTHYFLPELRTLYVFQNPVFTVLVNTGLLDCFVCG